MRDVCELSIRSPMSGLPKATPSLRLEEVAANSLEARRDNSKPYLLSPVDLQAVKASGVTFVGRLLERVIEEQARGAAEKADAIRADIAGLIGARSRQAEARLGAGDGDEGQADRSAASGRNISRSASAPMPRSSPRRPPMASVGFGADVGLHPVSTWNNPEPEIVMIAASTGKIVGATLGNDVNLRDVEGRSALLLGKAKDNNASAPLGPFIRLFDGSFSLDDVKKAEVHLKVEGEDGFSLEGSSSMAEISRSPEELVAATIGPHHQYPDGIAALSRHHVRPGRRTAARKARGSRTRSATSSPFPRRSSVRWSIASVFRPIAHPGPTERAI